MPDSAKPAKAQLIELDASFEKKSDGKVVSVQFNPETLKVSFANQLVQPANAGGGGAGDQSGPAARQFVGAGTTKLSLQLWFDVGAQLPESENRVVDVRELTKHVAYFITPKQEGQHFIPPAVRFSWGSFQFDGFMDSLEETLEFFSDEGIPLRASMTANMSQQRIQEFSGRQNDQNKPPPGATGSGGAGPGTSPLVQAQAGASLQSIAAGIGQAADWQALAEANGIENPRLLEPGQLIDLNISRL
jgi:hypothetical protein